MFFIREYRLLPHLETGEPVLIPFSSLMNARFVSNYLNKTGMNNGPNLIIIIIYLNVWIRVVLFGTNPPAVSDSVEPERASSL